MNIKKSNGFSLIELIVVISIIAVITAVGIVSFRGASLRGRDSRRVADLEKLRVALEMCRQVGGTYPDSANSLVSGGYIQALPTDPKGYVYYYNSPTDYTYTYDAHMEDLGSTNGAWGSNCGGGALCNYRVTNP